MVWLWFGCGLAVVWLWFGCGLAVVWLWFGVLGVIWGFECNLGLWLWFGVLAEIWGFGLLVVVYKYEY